MFWSLLPWKIVWIPSRSFFTVRPWSLWPFNPIGSRIVFLSHPWLSGAFAVSFRTGKLIIGRSLLPWMFLTWWSRTILGHDPIVVGWSRAHDEWQQPKRHAMLFTGNPSKLPKMCIVWFPKKWIPFLMTPGLVQEFLADFLLGECLLQKTTIIIDYVQLGEATLKYIAWCSNILYGGFLKWWYPTTIGFPTKNDHLRVFWGYHHLRKHPYLVCGFNAREKY